MGELSNENQNFIPQPVYPYGIDTDYTLFKVKNTTESFLASDNFAWSEIIYILPYTNKYLTEDPWPTNGFATINGELLYYNNIEKEYATGKIIALKNCIRNLGGEPSRFNKAGTSIRGFVVAEHHNQLVKAIVNLEKFIGIDFDTDQTTLDWKIRNLFLTPPILDDYGCPEINFTFTILETNLNTGILASYNLQINGVYTSFTIDFGDGDSTTSTLSGRKIYALSSSIDPVVTVLSPKCTTVQTALQRANPSEPKIAQQQQTLNLTIPACPALPNFSIPNPNIPVGSINIPPIVFPCINVPSFPSIPSIFINVPSIISLIPPIPSIISFGPVNIPSFISFSPINIPSNISFTNIPIIPSIISFANLPIIPCIISLTPIIPCIISLTPIVPCIISLTPTIPSIITLVGVTLPSIITFGPAPALGPVQFGAAPVIGPIAFGPAPALGPVVFGAAPALGPVQFGAAPALGPVQFGAAPALGPVLFGPAPALGPIQFGPANVPSTIQVQDSIPETITVTGGCFPSQIILTGNTIPNVISFTDSKIPDTILIAGGSSIPTEIDLNYGSPPTISVFWGTPPIVKCTVNIVCPSSALYAANNARNSLYEDSDKLKFSDLTMQMDYDTNGIPKEINLIVPEIRDIQVLHDIPEYIQIQMPEIKDIKIKLEDKLPTEIKIVSDFPSIIQIDAGNMPNTIFLKSENIPSIIRLESDIELPCMIKFDVGNIPQSISITGIPDFIEIRGSIPSEINLKMPENPEIEMVYKGSPIEVKIELDYKKILGDENGEDYPCFAIIPCKNKK